MFDLKDALEKFSDGTLVRKVTEKREEMECIRFELIDDQLKPLPPLKFKQEKQNEEPKLFLEEKTKRTSTESRLLQLVQLFYAQNIPGLIMAHQNSTKSQLNRRGKVRVLVRVLDETDEIRVKTPRIVSIRNRAFTFDKVFNTGRECSSELLRESLVSSIRYAIVGGNAVIIPIGGAAMGKTPLLTYQAETALAWSLEVLKQYPRIKMRLSVIEASNQLVDLINPDKPEVFELEDPLMGPKLSGHSEMLIRSALPGLRLLRRCFTRRQSSAHMLVTLTFHLPNGATGKLHLFDCGRGGSAILSSISPFILGAHHNHHYQAQTPLQTILRESLGSMTSEICLVPHVGGADPDKTVAVLQAVARMHRARAGGGGVAQQAKKRHHVTDCRSPLGVQQSDFTSATSEASHETVIYRGEKAKKRGYASDTGNYSVQVTPMSLHGVSAKSTSLNELPLPAHRKPPRVILSDQEITKEEDDQDIVVKCRPRVAPRTYANRRQLPLMSETEDEGARRARRQMETIREYPATDTEAVRQPPRARPRQRDNIRLVQMYDGSFQLETGNSRTTLIDSSTKLNHPSVSQSRLKKSSSLKNMLGFKKSKSTATLSPHSSPEHGTICNNGSKVYENGEMTMILPKHYLSEDDLRKQCEEMRSKYKYLVSQLPKKHRKKYEWSGAERLDFKRYTSDYLLRLEIEIRRIEALVDQKTIKTCNTRNFSLFGFRIGI